MRRLTRVRVASATSAALAFGLGATYAGAAAQERASAGVYTNEQVASGKAAFAKTCAACHMPDLSGDNDVPQLAGMNFMNTWRSRSTRDLLNYMSTAMPPGGLTLGPDTYAAITAFVLESNGAVAGAEALTNSTVAVIGNVTAPAATP